jgi:hypothetical protein
MMCHGTINIGNGEKNPALTQGMTDSTRFLGGWDELGQISIGRVAISRKKSGKKTEKVW